MPFTVIDERNSKYVKSYLFIKGFAMGRGYAEVVKALAIADEMHYNQNRKGGDPYIVHPLNVCSNLISLGVDNPVVLSAALLHDVVEDCGINPVDLVEKYGLPQRIVDVVLILTKRKDESEEIYYARILGDVDAVMVKLSDRCNNVSTMQPFSEEKMLSYIDETKTYIGPLCRQAKIKYPELSNPITSLKHHINSVCDMAEYLLKKH